MFRLQIKLGDWQDVRPTAGEPYEYPTREAAQRMLGICYPDHLLIERLGGPQVVRVFPPELGDGG